MLKIRYPEGLHNTCFKFLVRSFPGKAQLKSHGYQYIQSTIISSDKEPFCIVPGNLKTGQVRQDYYLKKETWCQSIFFVSKKCRV